MSSLKPKTAGGTVVRKYPKNWRWGLLFILPWLLGFLILQAYPLIMSLYYSFTDYSFGSQYDFVGLANYLQIFTKDREVKNSLAVTFKFVFMSVPMKLVMALLIFYYCSRIRAQ